MRVERELVRKASEGDKDAFSDLYYSCYKDLYKFALYNLGNADDAADVVSDVFVDIWKGIGKLRDPDSFVPWVFKILQARCKKEISDIIRRKSVYSIDNFTEIPFLDSENMEEELLENANLALALSKLESEERTILILSVLYGYTRREIAEFLGKPQGTVASKLYRTYAKLRKQLTEK